MVIEFEKVVDQKFVNKSLTFKFCCIKGCTFENCTIEFIYCQVASSIFNNEKIQNIHHTGFLDNTIVVISHCNISNSFFTSKKQTLNLYSCSIHNSSFEDGVYRAFHCTLHRISISARFVAERCAISNSFETNGLTTKDCHGLPLVCPSNGSFIGWKKLKDIKGDWYLAELEIPADAKRCSAGGYKCRCDKAKVLSIKNIFNNSNVESVLHEPWTSLVNQSILYKVGEMVYPDEFTEDRYQECSHGIHFFIDQESAIHY